MTDLPDDQHRVIADVFRYMLTKTNVKIDLSKLSRPEIDPRDQQL